MLAEDRSGNISLAGSSERLCCTTPDYSVGQRLHATSSWRKGRLKFKDASEHRPLLVPCGREVFARTGGEYGRIVEPQKRKQTPSTEVFGDGTVGAQPRLEQLWDRLAQKRLRFIQQTNSVQHFSPAQERNAVVLIGRDLACGRHLGEGRRRVTEHAQVKAGIVPGEGYKHRLASRFGVLHSREIVGQRPLDIPEIG